MAKIDSVYDFTEKGLVELKSWLEPWFLTRDRSGCCVMWEDVGIGCGPTSFHDCVLSTPGLVGYWPASEASGDLIDLVAGDHMVAVTSGGKPTYGNPGPFTDTAVGFDGAEGFGGNAGRFRYTLGGGGDPIQTALTGTSSWTLESWIYPTGYAASSQTSIVNTWDQSTTPGSISASILAAGTLSVLRKGISVTSSSSVPLNTWTHWRATYDGADLRLYINGVLDGTSASSDTSAFTSAGSYLVMGNLEGPTSFWTPFRGYISDLAVYDTTVTTFCF